jgi:hypothetical protein
MHWCLKNTCRKCPALRNTCHGPRTSLPQHAFHPTYHVQQDIHPTDNPPPSARKSGAGEERRRVGRRRGLLPSSVRQSLCVLVILSSAPSPGAPSPWDCALGVIEDSISQCTFLQMTYTTENPHADGSAAPGARPRFRPPRRRDPHATSPAPTTTGWREDRCPVVSKRPLHSRAAAKMSPHIRICPDPVLAAHAPSPPAAGSHCPAREDSAPHCGTEFSSMLDVLAHSLIIGSVHHLLYADDESTLPHLPFGCFWLRLKKEKNKISNRMKKSLMSLVVIY